MADLAHQSANGSHTGETRRDFLILTATAIGGVGVAAAIWPFIGSLNPARDTLALATTEVDLAPVQVGQRLTVAWRGKPVFIDHRTPEEIKAAENVTVYDTSGRIRQGPAPQNLIVPPYDFTGDTMIKIG